jgi:thiaminase/2-hydroxy-3-keto-5-methylthiopentenyl-1-phosphate phosphatase
MSISSRLWIRCIDQALASATSPFVVSLTRGSLTKHAFKAYIAQDAFYLDSFKQAFASAATICRKDSDGFGVNYFEKLEVLVEDELKMHAKFAFDLNIDLTTITPFPQTLLYTDFLGEAAKTNYVSHICAAMTPCMTLYAWLGRRAKIANLANVANPYAKWIDEYSSVEFSANSERLEMLLDHYAAQENQDYDGLLKLYSKAMELEYKFFSAHETPNWTGVSPGLLGIDFDDTISLGDTISSLCKAGLKAQGKDDEVYKNLLVNFTTKYEAFMASNLVTQNSVGNTSKFHRDNFEKFMTSYSAFETDMLNPIEESSVLKGLSFSSIEALSREIAVKPGSVEFLKFALSNFPGMDINVLSVNWSKTYLQSILANHMQQKRVVIHSNELEGLFGDTVNAKEIISEGSGDLKLAL